MAFAEKNWDSSRLGTFVLRYGETDVVGILFMET